MSLTLEELKKRHPNAQPRKTFTLKDLRERHDFGRTEPLGKTIPDEPGFLEKAGDFIGGGPLAKGLAQVIAAPEVERINMELIEETSQGQRMLIEAIRENKAQGKDTSRLEEALRKSQEQLSAIGEKAVEEAEEAPSGKQIVGSAARLGGLAVAGPLFKGLSKVSGVAKPGGAIVKGLRTGLAGGAAGGIEGAIQAGGAAAEQDLDPGEIAISSILGGGLGLTLGGALGLGTGAITSRLARARALKQQRNELLQQGTSDSRAAKFLQDAEGTIRTDPVAVEAVKQGVDEGTVALIKGSSNADKSAMRRMMDIFTKAKTDKRFGTINRPSDVVGQTALTRFNAVANANKEAAKQLDNVAQGLKGNKVELTEPVTRFVDELEAIGVGFKNGKPAFEGSDIEGISAAEGLIKKVVKRMNNVSNDAYEIHKLKRFIDEQVKYGKTAEGLTGRAELVVKQLRRNLDDLLDSNFGEYNKVNTQFAETKEALDTFGSLAGRKFDPNSPSVEGNLGNLMRRITSNARSRTDVIDAMNKLQNTAERYGSEFDDDLITQLDFVTELERLFGSSAPTSIKGQISDPIENILQTRGRTLTDLGIEGVRKAREGLLNINEEALEDSLRELLR